MENNKHLPGIPPEPSWLSQASCKVKSAWRVVKAAYPFLLLQSDKASQKFAEHKTRLAKVDAYREFIVAEAKTMGALRKEIWEKYLSAPSKERWKLKKDLRELESELSHLMISVKALEYIDDFASEEKEPPSTDYIEISPHWLDKFFELSSKRNEPWRANLLSMALARESIKKDSISAKTLWNIGTLDEDDFHSFSHILDVCSTYNDAPIIPIIPPAHIFEIPVPECLVENRPKYGNLIFALDEYNLMATEDVHMTFHKGDTIEACYGGESFEIHCQESLSIPGVLLTGLGMQIAALYVRKPNEVGRKLFSDYIAFLKRGNWSVTRLS